MKGKKSTSFARILTINHTKPANRKTMCAHFLPFRPACIFVWVPFNLQPLCVSNPLGPKRKPQPKMPVGLKTRKICTYFCLPDLYGGSVITYATQMLLASNLSSSKNSQARSLNSLQVWSGRPCSRACSPTMLCP